MLYTIFHNVAPLVRTIVQEIMLRNPRLATNDYKEGKKTSVSIQFWRKDHGKPRLRHGSLMKQSNYIVVNCDPLCIATEASLLVTGEATCHFVG